MLNLGRALQRPFESEYNAYRRFLVANGRLDITEIRKELHLLDTDFYESRTQISTDDLFRNYVENNEQIKQTTDFQSLEKNKYKHIRNCPKCAQGCFHSDLYQFNWLTVCPIHGEPLTYSCPECNKQWPKLGEIKYRKCHTCGSTYHWDELRASNAFRLDTNDAEKLEFLNKIINDYKNHVKGAAIKLYARKEILNMHKSINIDHALFPSLMAIINPALTPTLDQLNIKHTKFKKFIYKIEPTTKFLDKMQPYYDNSQDNVFAKKVRKTMERQIRRELKNKFNVSNLKCPKEFLFEEYHYLVDESYLPGIAFTVWKTFVDENSLECGEMFGSHKPIMPCLLTTLVLEEEDVFEIIYVGKTHTEYITPIEIQTALYKYDLWITFTNILYYLNAYKYFVKNELTWSELDELVSDGYQKIGYKSQHYAFITLPNNTVKFFQSEESTNFSLRNFKPFSQTLR